MSSDTDESISFRAGSSSKMRLAGRPSVPAIVATEPNESTSLLGSEDGRPPTRNFTEEIDREEAVENDDTVRKSSSDEVGSSGKHAATC